MPCFFLVHCPSCRDDFSSTFSQPPLCLDFEASGLVLDKCTHSVRARTHKQTSKATISKLLRPSSVAKIRGLAAAGVTRCRKRCKVSFHICVYNIEHLVSHTAPTLSISSEYQLSNRSGRINTELGTHLAGGHASSPRDARGQWGDVTVWAGEGEAPQTRAATPQAPLSAHPHPPLEKKK